MDFAFPEHVVRRRTVICNALSAARATIVKAGLAPDKVYYIYVPDGADAAITETLDPLKLTKFANRADIRGLANLILRPIDEITQPIGPVR